MKSYRLILALVIALPFAGVVARADATAAKPAKPVQADCGCEVGTDGKVCGVDKDCCCKDKKAAKPVTKSAAPSASAKSAETGKCPAAKCADKGCAKDACATCDCK